MGVLRRMAGAVGVLAALTVAACGDDDARWVGSPDGDGSPVPEVVSAAVDADGSVVLASRDGVFTAQGDGEVLTPRRPEIPAELGRGATPHGISVDRDGRAWALIGDAFAPVRVFHAEVHDLAATLQGLRRQGFARPAPGSDPGFGRRIHAVAVVEPETLLVASGSPMGTIDTPVNVLVHRIARDGTGTLVAGRAWTGPAGRPRPAAELQPGAEAPATQVDLDDVLAVQPLDGDDLLIATRAGGPVSFFVVRGTTLRRLDVPRAWPGRTVPRVLASRVADGRVVLNLRTGASESEAKPVALLLDPATGRTSVLRKDLTEDTYRGSELLVADGGAQVLVVSPDHDGREDDDHPGDVRLTTLAISDED